MKERWSSNDIYNNVTKLAKDEWVEYGVINETTRLKNGFLSNRMRNMRKKFVREVGELKDLLTMPKFHHSEIGVRKGLTTDGKGIKKESSNVEGKAADDNSASQSDPEIKVQSEIDDGCDAQEQAVSPDSVQVVRMELSIRQDGETPLGSFCGVPLWSRPGERSSLEAELVKVMRTIKSKAKDIVDSDIEFLGASPSAKEDKMLALLGWDEQNRKSYTRARETTQSVDGHDVEVDLATHVSDIAESWMQTDATEYLNKNLDQDVWTNIAEGDAKQRFAVELRRALYQGSAKRIVKIRDQVQKQWIKLQKKRRPGVGLDTIGARKRKNDDADADSLKKTRLESNSATEQIPPMSMTGIAPQVSGTSQDLQVPALGLDEELPQLPENDDFLDADKDEKLFPQEQEAIAPQIQANEQPVEAHTTDFNFEDGAIDDFAPGTLGGVDVSEWDKAYACTNTFAQEDGQGVAPTDFGYLESEFFPTV